MIAAFLQAEIHSPRFKKYVRSLLGGDLRLVQRPRLDDRWENEERKKVLAGYRGYGQNSLLFQHFPTDIDWQRVILSRDEVGALKYAGVVETWRDLSNGSRLVRDGAANVETVSVGENANANILAVEAELLRGRTYPEIIIAAVPGDTNHVLIEGHTRATAYYRAFDKTAEVEAIVAYSPHMATWGFY